MMYFLSILSIIQFIVNKKVKKRFAPDIESVYSLERPLEALKLIPTEQYKVDSDIAARNQAHTQQQKHLGSQNRYNQ